MFRRIFAIVIICRCHFKGDLQARGYCASVGSIEEPLFGICLKDMEKKTEHMDEEISAAHIIQRALPLSSTFFTSHY